MASFAEAVEKTLKWEGGYSNDPSDPGGETNWGISKRSYPHADIRNMTYEQAVEIYRQDYWNSHYDLIHDQEIANQLFDFGVNAGMHQAVKTLQESIGYFTVGPIVADGIFGPKTLEALNSVIPTILLKEFRARRAAYYGGLNKPKYLLGWLRRTMA